ncbi:MAG: hypothetical protein JXB46_06470 [Candidatus Eisenbacteria bacterium]|nr:hypothetical protein [Candidatus Eisenbacteria bacterium]
MRSAQIVADDQGGILEVHVVADASRSAKQIARDVESMIVAKLGTQMDHRKISVAQIDPGDGGDSAAPVESAPAPVETPVEVERAEAPIGERRIRFIGVSVSQANMKALSRVELELEGVESVAAVESADTPGAVLRSICEATLQAVSQFLTGEGVFSVGAVEHSNVGLRQIVVVNVCYLAGREEKTLVGACPITADVTQAAALATLDAINRFLYRLTLKESTEYEIGPASE